jgi:hypothetical protein
VSEPLRIALSKRESAYRSAIDTVERAVEEDAEAYAAARSLREAVELVGCLRRLLPAASVEQLHRAFGAPGDFGYETPIGDALARVYGLRSDDG